jgi:hypothetical protein
MNIDKKIVAAIGVAVTSYIADEKAAALAAGGPESGRAFNQAQAANVWGTSGRQEIMRNRQIWQMRLVPR